MGEIDLGAAAEATVLAYKELASDPSKRLPLALVSHLGLYSKELLYFSQITENLPFLSSHKINFLYQKMYIY